jgi:Transposase DNA-binding
MEGTIGLDTSFGSVHFGAARLGDLRRTKRLVRVADALVRHPGGTFPDKLPDPHQLDAFYNLMAAEDVTHQSVLEPHIRHTLAAARGEPGVVLILHDTTVLDYSGLDIPELGQIGNGHGRGYYCHNSLAITADRRVLGLLSQVLHVRRVVPPGETKARRRAHERCESRLWRDAAASIPAAPAGRTWVDIADRGADITEFLDHEDAAGKCYVVRSQHNRIVEIADPDAPGGRRRTKLHDLARTLPATAWRAVEVSAQPGQPARTARVGVAYAAVAIIPPRQPRGRERGVPLEVVILRAYEGGPPAGVKPLEWILLTNVATADDEQAGERVAWYAARPVVEEYHKAQKTGCAIEQMQWTHADRLKPAIALVSVVASTLLGLRALGRDERHRDEPAAGMVPRRWVELLARWRYGEARSDLTVEEFIRALGRLGGHQNRPSDGPPGWITLWRGWTRLMTMALGAELECPSKCGGT